MAAYLGEPVDVLRTALRPPSARSGQGDALATRTGAGDTALADGAVSPIQQAMFPAPGVDNLLRRVRAFPSEAGLDDCVEAAPMSPAGFRLSSGPEEGIAEPARHRACWLLASISGQVDVQANVPVAPDQDFIHWLANPGDASSTAFWEMLTFLRQTGGDSGADASFGEPARPCPHVQGDGLCLVQHDSPIDGN